MLAEIVHTLQQGEPIRRNERAYSTAGRIDKGTGRGEDKGKGKGKTKDRHRGKGFSPFDKEATAEGTGAAGLKPEPPSIRGFDDLEVELGEFTLKQEEEESSRAVQL